MVYQLADDSTIFEINTCERLRELSHHCLPLPYTTFCGNHPLRNGCMQQISQKALGVTRGEIVNIRKC